MTPKMRQHASTALEWAKGVYVPILLALLGGGLLRTSQTAQQAQVATVDQSEQIMALSGQVEELREELYAAKQGLKPRVTKAESRIKLLEASRLERSRQPIVTQRAAAAADTVTRSPGLLSAPRRWGAALWNRIRGR